jgi:hypothetical protein
LRSCNVDRAKLRLNLAKWFSFILVVCSCVNFVSFDFNCSLLTSFTTDIKSCPV